MEMERSSVRKPRETQSEIGDYGFGRRSCDTDPRLSLDIARLSVDDSRYSFDEPRASWDGYLIGKTCPRLTPMVSVREDVKLPGEEEGESGKDGVKSKNGGECSPGGTAQTRDYYTERRRRRSFDKSGLNRRVDLVDDELKSISNAKVSPETVGLFHGAKLLVTEKELRDSNWYSLKGYPAESVVDSLSKDVGSGVGDASKKGFKFKGQQRWRSLWNVWGLMQRRSESKSGDEESSVGGNAVNEPMVESLQKLSEVANGEVGNVVSPKLLRSYTVSARGSCKMASSACDIEATGNDMKRREDAVLQQNRGVKHSPNNLDHGLFRFYLTPLRSYGRAKSGKNRLMNRTVARNVL
uniref:Uncharacterized protein n=1 Tax=Rhizophora mucronata TaxID=61149 RepID=A0A2P2NLG6_RHIMU